MNKLYRCLVFVCVCVCVCVKEREREHKERQRERRRERKDGRKGKTVLKENSERTSDFSSHKSKKI